MITLGADPEFLVARNGVPDSVVGQLGGTKGDALDIGGGFAIQEDNVMAEWNISPQTDADDFAWAIERGFQRARDFVRTKMGEDIEVLPWCWAEFDPGLLQNRQARTFGCAPDFNAYQQGAAKQVVSPDVVGNRRFAGGHVHIGYHDQGIPKFVAACFADAFLGVWSLARYNDAQGPRRELYGQAGSFRPTEYGIEYRVLSNFWTVGDDRAARDVGINAMKVGLMMEQDPKVVQHWFKEFPWRDIENAINREDRTLAGQLQEYIMQATDDALYAGNRRRGF